MEGVIVGSPGEVDDPRGALRRMLKASAEGYDGFGEVYFSELLLGAVKAWRKHTRMVSHLAVPVGRVRLVLLDDREGSRTRGETLTLVLGPGPETYRTVRVPPGVWSGFKGLAPQSLVANLASIEHDPAESERRDADDPAMPHGALAR